MNIQKLHKYLCISLFIIMFIAKFIMSYAGIIENKTIENIFYYIGEILEIPFLIYLVYYLYKYRKLKNAEKINKRNTLSNKNS